MLITFGQCSKRIYLINNVMGDINNQTVDSYNKAVDKYIESSPQIVRAEIKSWIDKNLKHLDKSAKILEIGSGTGKDARYIMSLGYEMVLTDASKGFVDFLNKRGNKAHILNAITDDLGDYYDMVFADAVFLHFNKDQLKRVLEKVFESLNPNGRIVFSLKAGKGEEITNRKLDVSRYFCYWDKKNINKLLEVTGYKNIQVETVEDYRGKTRPDWLLINAVK